MGANAGNPDAGESRKPRSIRAGADFYRAHGLGNDYLVFDAVAPGPAGWTVGAASVRSVCDRHTGAGSDGIVLLLDPSPGDGVFPLRMFNPDGSEFERSGNGLRVLASCLHRRGLVGEDPFAVACGGARIPMTVHGVPSSTGRYDISVDMGRAEVGPAAVGGDPDQLVGDRTIPFPGREPLTFVPVSVGNPHAVVFGSEAPASHPRAGVSIDEIGPFLSGHPAFTRGTNVQLVQVVAPARIRIEIWERGVGRTSASGTSACAAAVAAVHEGRIEPGEIEVEMEGGTMRVTVGPDLDVALRGPVDEVAEGRLTSGFLASLEHAPI